VNALMAAFAIIPAIAVMGIPHIRINAWVTGLIALAYVLYTSALYPTLGRPSLIINGVIVVWSIAC
jgi:hypothetical protein